MQQDNPQPEAPKWGRWVEGYGNSPPFRRRVGSGNPIFNFLTTNYLNTLEQQVADLKAKLEAAEELMGRLVNAYLGHSPAMPDGSVNDALVTEVVKALALYEATE